MHSIRGRENQSFPRRTWGFMKIRWYDGRRASSKSSNFQKIILCSLEFSLSVDFPQFQPTAVYQANQLFCPQPPSSGFRPRPAFSLVPAHGVQQLRTRGGNFWNILEPARTILEGFLCAVLVSCPNPVVCQAVGWRYYLVCVVCTFRETSFVVKFSSLFLLLFTQDNIKTFVIQ